MRTPSARPSLSAGSGSPSSRSSDYSSQSRPASSASWSTATEWRSRSRSWRRWPPPSSSPSSWPRTGRAFRSSVRGPSEPRASGTNCWNGGMRTFNVFDAPMTYDPSAPEPYGAGSNRFGPKIGANRMGATVYELPPGQSLCPYHYESEEEWLLVLQAQVTVRHPEGEHVLGPGDATAFPVGPAGAHKTTNNG